VTQKTKVSVTFQRPPAPINWTGLLLVLSTITMVVGFFVTVGRPFIDRYLRNRNMYLVMVLV